MAPKFNIGDRIVVADTVNWYRGKTAVVVEDHGYDGLLERRIYTVQLDTGSTVFFPLREEQIVRA